jgi:hypothetical protein
MRFYQDHPACGAGTDSGLFGRITVRADECVYELWENMWIN